MLREAIAAARFLASTAVKKATISTSQIRLAPPEAPAHSAVTSVTIRTPTGKRRRAISDAPPAPSRM
jgi:hypothetical protein